MKKIDPVILFFGLIMGVTMFMTIGISVYSEQFMTPLSFDEEESTYYREEGQIIVPVVPKEQSLEEMLAEKRAEEEELVPKLHETLDEYEQYLLAKIAMAEAEGEDEIGKALVICVVLNRVADDEFPNDVESVIYEEDQFAPIKNGRWDRVEPNDECYKALRKVMNGWDESKGAVYFESDSNPDNWHKRNCTWLFDHGCHDFYR